MDTTGTDKLPAPLAPAPLEALAPAPTKLTHEQLKVIAGAVGASWFTPERMEALTTWGNHMLHHDLLAQSMGTLVIGRDDLLATLEKLNAVISSTSDADLQVNALKIKAAIHERLYNNIASALELHKRVEEERDQRHAAAQRPKTFVPGQQVSAVQVNITTNQAEVTAHAHDHDHEHIGEPDAPIPSGHSAASRPPGPPSLDPE